jgi:tetratricopeptide (TPR) repeat protein
VAPWYPSCSEAAYLYSVPMPDPPAPPPSSGSRLPAVIWIALLLLGIARVATAFDSSMQWWGIDLLRFVAGPFGWLLAALAALALVPPLARFVAEPLARFSERRFAASLWAIAIAATVLVLPDRSRFVGDFALREIASHTSASDLGSLYPQGFPLDALLHDRWARLAASATPLGIAEWWRVTGAIEAALLAWLAARLARTLGAGGAWAGAMVAVVSMSGVALFAGYNKAFAELVVIVTAAGMLAIEATRRRGALVVLSAVVAAGLLLHRLGLALLPLWLVVLAFAWRVRTEPNSRLGRAWIALSLALPLVALAIVLPRLRGAAAVDAANFAPAAGSGGPVNAAFAIPHLLDLANAIVMLAPLAPFALLAPLAARGRPRSEALVLGALALPLLAFPPFYHPPQGVFRDWDALAPTAASLAVMAAWSLTSMLATRRAHSWLAAPIALAAIAPALQLLLLQSDPGSAIERARRFAEEPPARSEYERATVWDWMGASYLELGLADSASTGFERAARLTPSPRILREWAAAELMRGRPDTALGVYRRLLERKPDDVSALVEFALLAHRAGDDSAAAGAARRALLLDPNEPRARAMLEAWEATRPAGVDTAAGR